MKLVLKLVSMLSLLLILAAPALFYAERIALDLCKQLLLGGTVAWFASAPGWMGRPERKVAIGAKSTGAK